MDRMFADQISMQNITLLQRNPAWELRKGLGFRFRV